MAGNWALKWQNSHIKNKDWYECSSAHSYPLNANQKAYAAWNLWARLAGWNQTSAVTPSKQTAQFTIFPNPSSGRITVSTSSGSLTEIKIFNEVGVSVYSESVNKQISNLELDISFLATGVYFVRIYNGEDYLTEKMVVN